MREKKFLYLPTKGNTAIEHAPAPEVVGDSPCPCCGCITIPNGGDALAYICPVCFWEIDLFICSEQNHGLTLEEARKNYQTCGASLPRRKKHCREPKENELAPKE